MTLQGSSRTYVLVRIVSDDGLHGIGEAYGTPGVGVSEQILSLKPWLVGKDPLEIDTLYTELGVGTRDLWHSHGWFRAQLDSSPSRKG